MADRGSTGQSSAGHSHRTSSWITVAVIMAGVIVLAIAFVARSWVLTGIGLVVLVVGMVLGVVGRIMDDAY